MGDGKCPDIYECRLGIDKVLRENHDTKVMLQRLINKVNMVTAFWRGQGMQGVSDGSLAELYDRQIMAEKFLKDKMG